MEITWLGHAAFRLRARLDGTWVTIVTDPYSSQSVGWKFPKVTADIVLVSHQHPDHNAVQLVGGDGGQPKVLQGPGEYEVKGVMIQGVGSWHDDANGAKRGENTIFVVDVDGLRLVHLGDLGQKLTDHQLGEIGMIDIVLVPTGGFYTITPQVAAEVVSQLEPKVVIPMHYKVAGMESTFDQLCGVEDFIKAMGQEPKRMDKLEIKKEAIGEEMQLIVLELKR